MLSLLLTKRVVLPKILVTHTTSSWPPSSPQYEFWYYGFPVNIPHPWTYCVAQLDSILHADELIPTYDL